MIRVSRVVVAVFLLIFVGGCGEKRVAELGVVLPLSGPWSIYGEPIRKGIELAVDEINQRHQKGDFPHRVEIDVRDSESRPEKAAEALRELDRKGVLGTIGGVMSAEALAMIEVANDDERILLSPSASSPALSGMSRYFYRIYPSDFMEGTRLGSWVALNLDLESVVILTANNSFARGISRVFQNEFERYDGKVLEEIVYPEGTEDFAPFVRQALGHGPDAVYLADFADAVRRILAELARQGFEGRVLTTSAFAAPDVIEAAGEDAEGVILAQTVFDADSEDPKVMAFVQAYRDKYGETPGLFAAHGYDAMIVMAEASRLESSGLPNNFWKGLRALQDFVGVTGTIQFDSQGDVGKIPRVYVVQDGRLVDYDKILEQRRKELQEKRQQLFKELERLRRQGAGGGNG
jgi:branched-chain amino acid transport system substrate-binding protein